MMLVNIFKTKITYKLVKFSVASGYSIRMYHSKIGNKYIVFIMAMGTGEIVGGKAEMSFEEADAYYNEKCYQIGLNEDNA